LPFDVVIALIRIGFVALLYLFLVQVMRVLSRQVLVPQESAVLQASHEEWTPDGEPAGKLILADATRNLPAGTVFQLKSVNQVGRRAENDIILDDEFVSGEHALLAWRAGKWWLSDVASTNGTFINGEEIQEPTAVKPGGRRAENDIILDDEFVSGEHALLAWRAGKWWLSDVASTNGTFINGEEIQEPTAVKPGDVLIFGKVKTKLG